MKPSTSYMCNCVGLVISNLTILIKEQIWYVLCPIDPLLFLFDNHSSPQLNNTLYGTYHTILHIISYTHRHTSAHINIANILTHAYN